MRVRPLRRRIAVAIAGAVALSLALAGCSADRHVSIDVPAQADAAFPDELTQQLQDAVTQAMTVTGSSGAIVGVWAPWSGSWVTGLGTESFDSTTAVSTDMVFRAARITRPMICDVLFQLAEQGTVKLDDSVITYVSGVPDLKDVTLLQLCDSTAGIGSYTPTLFDMWVNNPARVWNPSELASYGIGQDPVGQPGAGYRDSDAGYILLGLALERATGKKASALLQEYVFDPLDLTSTQLPANAAAKPSATAPVLNGHHSLPDETGALNCTTPLDITTMSASTGFTDSGVVSDIADLGRYAQGLAAGALVPKSADRFATPYAPAADAPTWFTTSGGAMQAGSLIGQFGSVPGYSTAAFSDPNTGLTVAVVLNNSRAGGAVSAYLGWELAALASKAPAASGQTAPDAGLPWTAQQYHDLVAASAICAAPAP